MASSSPYASDVGQADLVEFIDWRSVECLNQKSSHPIVNTMKLGYRENENLILESDVDEQILIYIPFTQVVKLHSFLMLGPEDEGPKTVKFYVNKEHMGFSNVNDYSPSDTVVLNHKNLEGEPVNLKYVKFQNVRSLTIFIEDNQNGEEVTKVGRILLYGSTVDTTNMKDLKKVEEH